MSPLIVWLLVALGVAIVTCWVVIGFLLRDFIRAQRRLAESGRRLSEATGALADFLETTRGIQW